MVVLIVGNWKMHGSRNSVRLLVDQLLSYQLTCSVVICPPTIFLASIKKQLAADSVPANMLQMGGQNLDWHASGAYTGEVSASMLAEFGCKYSIIGHSERRILFGETDEQVALKCSACLKHGLSPILCLGETLQQRVAGETEAVIAAQLDKVLDLVGITAFEHAIIAYEPVWAIGTGETATPHQAEAVHDFIRQKLAMKDRNIPDRVQILYGGSVNEHNASGLFAMHNIDGALVGGASLDPQQFAAICQIAEKS